VSAIRADQPQTLTAAEKFGDDKNTYGALAALEVAQQRVDERTG
jgi:predicted negative regulator of RcsB-dependent stress response